MSDASDVTNTPDAGTSAATSSQTNTMRDLEVRAEALGVPVLRDVPEQVDKKVLHFIPEDAAKKYGMAVFGRDQNMVHVAMVDPENFEAHNLLRFLAEKEQVGIEVYLTTSEIFEELLKFYTGTDQALKEAIQSLGNDESVVLTGITEDLPSGDQTDVEVLQDAPIARLVEAIVKNAIDGKASDIHIEPADGNYRVRFRVDGVLRILFVLPMSVGRAVVARIKILSNLKIDEQRKPQDGRFRVTKGSAAVDLRVSTFPVVDGEKVVMRVLDKSDSVIDFDKLGLWGQSAEILRAKIAEPFGIILITGPTGSGKSTTLYSFLQILNKEERNIVTLEDPVEYSVAGINQSQVQPEIGYSFAAGLRSILRQDPNVIMVGEIRDTETAELAIHAALTGHLVLSTLHTNDAIGAIPRLVDMGIEPFLLSSSLQVVAAQRLVRRICAHCKVEETLSPKMKKKVMDIFATIPPEECKKYKFDPQATPVFWKGKGCKECGQSGYRGRIAVYETFAATDQVKRIITDDRANEGKLKQEAMQQRMLTMQQDGLMKVLLGHTTLTEIGRVTEGGIMVDEE